MEGGLNSPSEILEPVGKPQLFKCRKSWFYKMLTWSAQGTGERMAERKKPPSSTPTAIYLETDSKGKGKGAVTKEGEIKEDNYNYKMERVWKRSTFISVKSSNHSAPADRAPICKHKQDWRKVKRDDKTAQCGPHFPCMDPLYFCETFPAWLLNAQPTYEANEIPLFHASFPCTFIATILLSLTRLCCFEEMNKMK